MASLNESSINSKTESLLQTNKSEEVVSGKASSRTGDISQSAFKRALAHPGQASYQTILRLQQTVGNRAVTRLIQNRTQTGSIQASKVIQRKSNHIPFSYD